VFAPVARFQKSCGSVAFYGVVAFSSKQR
jgi:hypothetical protein